MKKLLFALVPVLLFSCSDPCKTTNCQNGGQCNDGTCICPDQYTGPDCATLWRESVIGAYNGSGQCGGTFQQNQTIIVNPSQGTNIERIDFDNGFFGLMTGPSSFNIPSQTYYDPSLQRNVIINYGGGTVENNNLYLNLNYTVNSNTYFCVYTFNRL